MVDFQNSVPKVFTVLSIDVVVFKCRKTSDGKSVKSCVIYLTEKKLNFNCL